MIHTFPVRQQAVETAVAPIACEHRAVSKDGRIVCAKIAQGNNTVTPEICRACPASSINCAHLRFSLDHTAHVPLVVRFNGHTEVWTDDAPELRFRHAACAVRVALIAQPRACASCPLRVPCQAGAVQVPVRRPASANARVVAFPAREPEAALAAG